MAGLIAHGVYLKNGMISETRTGGGDVRDDAKKTLAYQILDAHNAYGADRGGLLGIRFDAMASHDITYVGIIQTARASGLKEFPIPYVLTNCHNSLCAVGGTINEDDHVFGLSAAKKYGGIFVPPHIAVIHQYMREKMSGCGRMIIGSDSHTRYGALGTLAVGEGGPELVKQLLGRYWEIKTPEVVLVYLKGKPRHGTGPQDVALSIIRDVFKNGFVKNRILEFAGPGVHELSMDFRNGIDVMTTETACLSSVWVTDEKTREYYRIHGREADFKKLEPGDGAYYDRAVVVDLSKVESMIALPFHPSNAYTVHEFLENAEDILRQTEKAAEEQFGKLAEGCGLVNKYRAGRFFADQGVIAGCSGGTYENIMRATSILSGGNTGSGEYSLSVYPASQPVNAAITANGTAAKLMNAGAVIKTCFCGPCFGAGDVPANNGFSIRHTTRNFPNREGSRPQDGQLSWVALMDAASIAATSANGGVLTAANDVEFSDDIPEYVFDDSAYRARVYDGFKKAAPDVPLKFGPNIADWPEIQPLRENLLLEVASVIGDEVTTTDELIPSGETSSYRSNPIKLAGFALSRRDPEYAATARKIKENGGKYASGENPAFGEGIPGIDPSNTSTGSVVAARCPGDGSAREQAASCQRVLGGAANIAEQYATKRYRSNLINWGMMPFTVENGGSGAEDDLFGNGPDALAKGDRILVRGIAKTLSEGGNTAEAEVYRGGTLIKRISLSLGDLSSEEREILLAGCLINYYSKTLQ